MSRAGAVIAGRYQSLREVLDGGAALSPERTMALVAQVARTVGLAHRRGAVHGDLRPDQIRLGADDDVAVNRDDEPAPATQRALYRAPEQSEGRTETAATDLYALGVIAYECLTGRPPFRAATAEGTARMHGRAYPPPLPDQIPVTVRGVVTAALAKDPAARWASARAMADAAEAARADLLAASPPTAPIPVPVELLRRRSGVSSTVLYVAVALAAAVVLVTTVFVVPRLANAGATGPQPGHHGVDRIGSAPSSPPVSSSPAASPTRLRTPTAPAVPASATTTRVVLPARVEGVRRVWWLARSLTPPPGASGRYRPLWSVSDLPRRSWLSLYR